MSDGIRPKRPKDGKYRLEFRLNDLGEWSLFGNDTPEFQGLNDRADAVGTLVARSGVGGKKTNLYRLTIPEKGLVVAFARAGVLTPVDADVLVLDDEAISSFSIESTDDNTALNTPAFWDFSTDADTEDLAIKSALEDSGEVPGAAFRIIDEENGPKVTAVVKDGVLTRVADPGPGRRPFRTGDKVLVTRSSSKAFGKYGEVTADESGGAIRVVVPGNPELLYDPESLERVVFKSGDSVKVNPLGDLRVGQGGTVSEVKDSNNQVMVGFADGSAVSYSPRSLDLVTLPADQLAEDLREAADRQVNVVGRIAFASGDRVKIIRSGGGATYLGRTGEVVEILPGDVARVRLDDGPTVLFYMNSESEAIELFVAPEKGKRPKTSAKRRTAAKKSARTRARNAAAAPPAVLSKKIPKDVRAAIEPMPVPIQATVAEIFFEKGMNDAVLAMLGRVREFETPTAAVLAGVALNPDAQAYFHDGLDKMWALEAKSSMRSSEELIVGSGPIAAAYAAVRVKMGYPKPVVFERNDRVGGIFATTLVPSIRINSRNRPGEPSIPFRPGSLNFLPGAPVQPAMLSDDEYQSNDVMAFVTRAMLAMYAQVLTGRDVASYDYGIKTRRGGSGHYIRLRDGRTFTPKRVIVATGLNNPKTFNSNRSPFEMLWGEYMRHVTSERFPFRDFRRIAVAGEGDGGKTAIETMIGQGPGSHLSVAGMDSPQIDWYGKELPNDRCSWQEKSRSRYYGIGRAFPNPVENSPHRITPINRKVERVSAGYNSILVDEVPYDLLVVSIGYEEGTTVDVGELGDYKIDGRAVAKVDVASGNLFVVGPAAKIELSNLEKKALGNAANDPDNADAMFRYLPRTAVLASTLPRP